MGRFSYLPVRGELSGASFEAQTTAFLESLANEISDNASSVAQALTRLQMLIDANIAAIKANNDAINSLQNTVTAQAAEINSLKAQLNNLQIKVNDLQGRIPPTGFIGIIHNQNVPDGWDECDGSNNTPDLTGMVRSPLKYIRKNVQAAGAS